MIDFTDAGTLYKEYRETLYVLYDGPSTIVRAFKVFISEGIDLGNPQERIDVGFQV